MNKCGKVDFLIVTPSANWEEDERILLAMRLDDKSTNQNTPLYSVTAVITPAIDAGYSVEQIDMRADRVSIKGLIDIIIRTGAKLVGFTAFTRQINDVGKMAMLIKELLPGERKIFPGFLLKILTSCHILPGTSMICRSMAAYTDTGLNLNSH